MGLGFGLILMILVALGIALWARHENVRRATGDDVLFQGVCSGIAAKFGVNVWAVRALWVVAALIALGFSVVLYLMMWMVVPRS